MKAFSIRLDDALYEQLSLRAKLNRRSRGMEVVNMIEKAMDQHAASDYSLLNPGTSDQTGTE